MNNNNDNNKDANDDEDSNDDNNDNDDDDDADDDADAMTMYIFIKTMNVIDHEHGGNVTGHTNRAISCVPDKGRGSLAKVSLLPHAVLSNYVLSSVNVVYDYYIDSIIERILDEKRVDLFPHKDGIKSLIDDDDDDSVDPSAGSSFIIDHLVVYSIVLSSMISFFREYESYWFQRRCKPYWPSRRENYYRRIVVPFCCKMLLDLTSATNYEVDMPTTLYSSLIFSIQRKHNR